MIKKMILCGLVSLLLYGCSTTEKKWDTISGNPEVAIQGDRAVERVIEQMANNHWSVVSQSDHYIEFSKPLPPNMLGTILSVPQPQEIGWKLTVGSTGDSTRIIMSSIYTVSDSVSGQSSGYGRYTESNPKKVYPPNKKMADQFYELLQGL